MTHDATSAIVLDKVALATFMEAEFPQVADQFAVERLTDTGIVMRLKVGTLHLRPGGTVSGPSMFALADVAIYLAILSRIGPVALAVTTSASIDFLRRPAPGQDLTCEVRILKLGRVLAVCDALIMAGGDPAPVARASMTYSIPPSAWRG